MSRVVHSLFVWACVLSVLAFVPLASASPALGDDEVALNDGSSLRGTIKGVDEGVEVRIDVLGERRVVPWSEVAEIERGKYAVAEDPTAVSLDTPAPGTPHVTIISDANFQYELMRVNQRFTGRVQGGMVGVVCESPCDQVVDNTTDEEWLIGGRDRFRLQPRSMPFQLPPKATHVELHVRGGRPGLRLAALLCGLAVTPTAIVGVYAFSETGTIDSRPVGFALLGTSAALAVGGITSLFLSRVRYRMRAKRVPQ